ncbi:type II secretion system protein GspL [Sphingomicrobium marinum]|uniref:type II secretion system protein GspL n=1 Tax=Sphingomicrobium marinum TaxID=1227950 RepID=UPI00223F1B38|nr:type II secretion system protein GspL [Sphingomicrobium marinum]
MNHLIILLPGDPLEPDAACAWWAAQDGALVTKGHDTGWLERIDDDTILTAIAPAGDVRTRLEADLEDPQARAAARLAMAEDAIGGAETLHSAAGDKPTSDGRYALALVDRAKMDAWLGWAAAHGTNPRQIIPAALLLPTDGNWHEAKIGGHHLIGRDAIAFEDDAAMAQALVGDEFVDTIDPGQLDDRIVREAMEPTLDLRQGDYAWKTAWRPDASLVRQIAILAGLIALVAIAIQVVQIVRLNNAAAELDAETAAIATAALGREVGAQEAESALMGNAVPGAAGNAMSALIAQVEAAGLVKLQTLGTDSSGMVSATLVAPDANAANAVLIGLQRAGWSITASNRPSDDGRQIVDLTMRSGR